MIYIAAPLFNSREQAFNARLREIIPYRTYLPQVDGSLISNLLDHGMPLDMAIKKIHHDDVKALHECIVMVAVLDGPHVDSGVAFEIGVFHTLRKPVVGFHADIRSELPFGLNPMIGGAMEVLVRNEVDLVAALKEIMPEQI